MGTCGVPRNRAAIAMTWLTASFSGRTLLVGVVIKLIAVGLALAFGDSLLLAAIDTVADVLIVIAALTIGYYLYIDVKRVVLWRVRRRLRCPRARCFAVAPDLQHCH